MCMIFAMYLINLLNEITVIKLTGNLKNIILIFKILIYVHWKIKNVDKLSFLFGRHSCNAKKDIKAYKTYSQFFKGIHEP